MKKLILIQFIILFIGFSAYSQESETETTKPVKRPVRSPWESGILMNHQTSVIAPEKTMEMHIQHRFGTIANGKKDVWGIMAPGANIRLGMNYSILNDLMVGYGLSSGLIHDTQLKYKLLTQTRDGSIPVSLTLYGNLAFDAQPDEAFGKDYKFTDRMSYFSEFIIGRKISPAISLQASANFTHYNSIYVGKDHDKIGIGAAGRFKFSPQSSLIVEYGLPLSIQSISEQTEVPKSNYHLSIGYEVSTSTHAFHIFVTNALSIVPQEIYMNNESLFDKNGIRFGFNITRLWSF